MPPEPKETSPCQEKTDDEQQTESTDENETPANDEEIDLEDATEGKVYIPSSRFTLLHLHFIYPRPRHRYGTVEILELNNRLDSLSTVLDSIEQQNDDLRAQILLLLDSQRETLKSFKEENSRIAAKGAEPSDSDEPMQQS
uniref:Uncharacterized protein n=1 Tax=Anopheles minimus TaxID=112268 RepID=A0A182W4T8_9DIPT